MTQPARTERPERPLVYVIVVHHLRPSAEVEAHAPEHIAYLERHHASGTFVASGQMSDTSLGGVILASSPSRESVEAISAEDPFVQAGVSRHEIYDFSLRRADLRVLEAFAATRAQSGDGGG